MNIGILYIRRDLRALRKVDSSSWWKNSDYSFESAGGAYGLQRFPTVPISLARWLMASLVSDQYDLACRRH